MPGPYHIQTKNSPHWQAILEHAIEVGVQADAPQSVDYSGLELAISSGEISEEYIDEAIDLLRHTQGHLRPFAERILSEFRWHYYVDAESEPNLDNIETAAKEMLEGGWNAFYEMEWNFYHGNAERAMHAVENLPGFTDHLRESGEEAPASIFLRKHDSSDEAASSGLSSDLAALVESFQTQTFPPAEAALLLRGLLRDGESELALWDEAASYLREMLEQSYSGDRADMSRSLGLAEGQLDRFLDGSPFEPAGSLVEVLEMIGSISFLLEADPVALAPEPVGMGRALAIYNRGRNLGRALELLRSRRKGYDAAEPGPDYDFVGPAARVFLEDMGLFDQRAIDQLRRLNEIEEADQLAGLEDPVISLGDPFRALFRQLEPEAADEADRIIDERLLGLAEKVVKQYEDDPRFTEAVDAFFEASFPETPSNWLERVVWLIEHSILWFRTVSGRIVAEQFNFILSEKAEELRKAFRSRDKPEGIVKVQSELDALRKLVPLLAEANPGLALAEGELGTETDDFAPIEAPDAKKFPAEKIIALAWKPAEISGAQLEEIVEEYTLGDGDQKRSAAERDLLSFFYNRLATGRGVDPAIADRARELSAGLTAALADAVAAKVIEGDLTSVDWLFTELGTATDAKDGDRIFSLAAMIYEYGDGPDRQRLLEDKSHIVSGMGLAMYLADYTRDGQIDEAVELVRQRLPHIRNFIYTVAQEDALQMIFQLGHFRREFGGESMRLRQLFDELLRELEGDDALGSSYRKLAGMMLGLDSDLTSGDELTTAASTAEPAAELAPDGEGKRKKDEATIAKALVRAQNILRNRAGSPTVEDIIALEEAARLCVSPSQLSLGLRILAVLDFIHEYAVDEIELEAREALRRLDGSGISMELFREFAQPSDSADLLLGETKLSRAASLAGLSAPLTESGLDVRELWTRLRSTLTDSKISLVSWASPETWSSDSLSRLVMEILSRGNARDERMLLTHDSAAVRSRASYFVSEGAHNTEALWECWTHQQILMWRDLNSGEGSSWQQVFSISGGESNV